MKAFGIPVSVSGVNSAAAEWAAALSPDELTMYMQIEVKLAKASRSSTAESFSSPMPLTELNSPSTQGSPSVTGDELKIYFFSDRPGGIGSSDIVTSVRATRVAAFGAPSLVANINTMSADYDPYILPDGHTLYFASRRNGTSDLFTAAIGSDGAFGAARAVAAANTADNEEHPVVTPDELTLYFKRCDFSDANGSTCEIMMSHRSTITDGFSDPLPVSELNSAAYDSPTWISADNCHIYLMSNREANDDIYQASRGL